MITDNTKTSREIKKEHNNKRYVDHTCRNCRYLAVDKFDGHQMDYCSIGNDNENAKHDIDQRNDCYEFCER
jgi:hypothetical protein